MKWISPILLLLIFSGCTVLGTNMIHSPTSDAGTPSKYRHVHGGATKKAPPDAVIFNVNDSVSILVSARVIWGKANFGGILLPIFPLFWLPKVDYYKNQPNSLIVEVSSLKPNQEVEIISATIYSNNEKHDLKQVRNTERLKELEFILDAVQTNEFELSGLLVSIDNDTTELPIIRFRKMKQHWGFIGP